MPDRSPNRFWLDRVFLSRSQRRLLTLGLPVFLFHKLAPVPHGCRDPFDYEPPARFEAKLGQLLNGGLRSGSLDALGQGQPPGRGQFVISFDDGYLNVARYGLPVLARSPVKAIQFLVADRLGRNNDWDQAKGEITENLMGVAEVRDWLAAGHQIGSHGLTHRNLAKIAETEVREEIFSSKKRLEDLFGCPVRHFSYPSGRYSPRIRQLVMEAGYETACTIRFGVNTAATDRFELRRIFPLRRGELLRKIIHRLLRKAGHV